MIYGPSYEGKTRECEACGHVTNVHHLCDVCEKHVCEKCDHGALGKHYCSPECFQETCSHDRLKLDVDGLFICRDCGALLDDEDIAIEIRRAELKAPRAPGAPCVCVNCKSKPVYDSLYCSDACKREFLTFSEDEDEDSCCPDYAAAYERRLEARAAYQEQFCGRNNY